MVKSWAGLFRGINTAGCKSLTFADNILAPAPPQVGLDRPTTQVYRNLIMMIPEGNIGTIAAYKAIDEVVAQVRAGVMLR